MKQIRLLWGYKVFLAFLFTCMQEVLLAQDSNQNTTKTTQTTTTEWYSAPWVWIVGGAIFIIILVALLRGNSGSTSETRTTVIKDNS